MEESLACRVEDFLKSLLIVAQFHSKVTIRTSQ